MTKKKEKKTKKNANQKDAIELDDGSSNKSTTKSWRRNNNNKKNSKQSRQTDNSNTADDVSFRKSLEQDGTRTVVDMAADGNCLFRSLSDQLYADYGQHHDQVRADVCDFMEQRQDEFSVFLVLDETESDHDAQDFASYISAMREEGEWGGNLELVAAAKCYTRNITVFSGSLAAFTIECGTKTTGPDLQISYHDNDHYNSVRPTNGNVKPIKPIPRTEKQPEKKKSMKTISSVSQSEEEGGGDVIEVELQPEQDGISDQGNQDDEPLSDDRSPSNTSGNDSSAFTNDNSNNDRALPPPPHRPPDPPASNESKVTTNKRFQNNLDAAKRRNGPCPCGSGLRYKKCCLAKEKHAARLKKLQGDDENESETVRSDIVDTKDEFTMNGHFRVLKI